MAIGDVTVELVAGNISGAGIDAVLTTQRAAGGSSGAYFIVPVANGMQTIVASISGV